jgi:hypothetical protein
MCLNNVFYNFNDEKFDEPDFKRTRKAGAIGTLTGPNVIQPNNVFAGNKFVNCQVDSREREKSSFRCV